MAFIMAIIAAISSQPATRTDAPWVGAEPIAAHQVRFVGGAKVVRPTYTYRPGDSRTVVFVHGGGWVEGDRYGIPGWMVAFQDAGWTVVSIDYTLNDPAQAALDVASAIARIRTELRPSRLVVAGWSAGAHLALAAQVSVDAFVLASTPFIPDVVDPVECQSGHPPIYIIYGIQDQITPWADNRASVRQCGLLGPTMVALVPGEHDPSADINNNSIMEYVS